MNRAADTTGRRHASDDEVYDSKINFNRAKSVSDLQNGQLSEFWVAEAKGEVKTTLEDLSTTKKAKSGFRNIFSNMKKSKSMEKLNERADMVHRDIEVNSQSSGGEKEPEKPKKRRTKKVPEPPTRKQSMGTDPIEISNPSQDSFTYFKK